MLGYGYPSIKCMINELEHKARNCLPENPLSNIQIKVIPFSPLIRYPELCVVFIHTTNSNIFM